MDLLILELIDPEIMRWLAERHRVRFAPELASHPQQLREALYETRALILPSSISLDKSLLHFAPELRVVGRISGSMENIDMVACEQAAIEVVRNPTATAVAEAEFMIGALLSMLRQTPVVSHDGMLAGRELGAATVGLLGMAPAARSVAQLLASFGSRVIGYDPTLHASNPAWERWRVEPVSLRQMFEQADAVCVQLGYYSRYRGLIGERVLPYCKQNQVMVSISPSGLFDEAQLALALRTRRTASVWFDSVQAGMLDSGRPLHGLANLRVTPRIASTTQESLNRNAWAVAQRIDELLQSAPPRWFRGTSPADFSA
jgi:phosphoglycerate dehydrogenase-like enzyme